MSNIRVELSMYAVAVEEIGNTISGALEAKHEYGTQRKAMFCDAVWSEEALYIPAGGLRLDLAALPSGLPHLAEKDLFTGRMLNIIGVRNAGPGDVLITPEDEAQAPLPGLSDFVGAKDRLMHADPDANNIANALMRYFNITVVLGAEAYLECFLGAIDVES